MLLFETKMAMRVRSSPSASAAVVGRMVAGEKFYSDKQEARPGKQEWARALDKNGAPIGWVCVYDANQRYLAVVPQPAPVVDTLPPVPEPPSGLDLMTRVIALEEWARKQGFKG